MRRAMLRNSTADMVLPLSSMVALENPWFRALCDSVDSVVTSDSLSAKVGDEEVLTFASLIMAFALVLLALCFNIPLLKRAGRDVEATQAMLLVLPDDVLTSNREVHVANSRMNTL